MFQIPSYELTIQARDNGSPVSQLSQVKVTIEIADINDNVPQFSQANYTAQVQVSSFSNSHSLVDSIFH